MPEAATEMVLMVRAEGAELQPFGDELLSHYHRNRDRVDARGAGKGAWRAVPTADGRRRHQLLDEPSGNVWDNAAMERFFCSLKTEGSAARPTARRIIRDRTCSTTSSVSTIPYAGLNT